MKDFPLLRRMALALGSALALGGFTAAVSLGRHEAFAFACVAAIGAGLIGFFAPAWPWPQK